MWVLFGSELGQTSFQKKELKIGKLVRGMDVQRIVGDFAVIMLLWLIFFLRLEKLKYSQIIRFLEFALILQEIKKQTEVGEETTLAKCW